MDRSYYLTLIYQYHDTRLGQMTKLEEIKRYISLFEEYKKKNANFRLRRLSYPLDFDAVKKFVTEQLDDYNDPKKKHVYLRGNNGKYLSGENGVSGMRYRDIPLRWEKFTIEELGNGKVALKSMGQYVSSEYGLDSMKCHMKKVRSDNAFKIVDRGGNLYSFKGNIGWYISTEDKRKLYCAGLKNDEASKFHVQQIQSPADEVQNEFSVLSKYTITLCNDYDAAEAEKANINSENFYYMKPVVIKHNLGNTSCSTQHEEKLFDQNAYKNAVKIAHKKIVAAREALDNHAQRVNMVLIFENKKLQEITSFYNYCTPAISELQNIIGQTNNAAATSEVNVEKIYPFFS